MTQPDAAAESAGDVRAGNAERHHKRPHRDGGAASLGLEIIRLLQTQLTVGPEVAGRAFGLGRSASYRACDPEGGGAIPAMRIGGKIVVPTAPIRRLLGIPDLDTADHGAADARPATSSPVKARRKRARPARRRRARQ
jgi:hypothetical protein